MARTLKGIALQQLRKAFHISRFADREKTSDLKSIAEFQNEQYISRRKFLGDVAKAAAVVSIGGLYTSCKTEKKATHPVIAIVGAGIAGLHAAYILKQAGYPCELYEGSPRTGGRIITVDGMMGEGLWTEMGGEFIDSTHQDILNLAQQFELPLIDRKAASELKLEEFAYFFDNKYYKLKDILEALHPFAEQIQKDIDSLSDEISFENHSPVDVQLDNLSILEYADRLGIKGWFRDFINYSYTAEYGMEASEQSAINFLSIFNPGDENSYELYGDSDERYSVAGGNSRICDGLANELKEELFVNHKLTAISESNSRYVMTFKIGGSGEIDTKADILILTLPLTTLREVDIRVPLPDWKMNAIRNIGYGMNSKLFVGVNERVWRKLGYAGYAFSNNGLISGYDHTQMQNNNTGKGGYTIFLGGQAGIACGNIDSSELQKQYVPALNAVFPGVQEQYNNNFQKWHWPSYAYSKGSYMSFSRGQFTTLGGAQYKPIGNMYFAGEHCSYEFQGFMNGGAETGRQVAEMVLEKLKTKAVA